MSNEDKKPKTAAQHNLAAGHVGAVAGNALGSSGHGERLDGGKYVTILKSDYEGLKQTWEQCTTLMKENEKLKQRLLNIRSITEPGQVTCQVVQGTVLDKLAVEPAVTYEEKTEQYTLTLPPGMKAAAGSVELKSEGKLSAPPTQDIHSLTSKNGELLFTKSDGEQLQITRRLGELLLDDDGVWAAFDGVKYQLKKGK